MDNMTQLRIYVAFTPATTREPLENNENLSTLIGKIAKVIADLEAGEFSNIANINDVEVTGDLDSVSNLKIAGKVVAGTEYTIDGVEYVAEEGAEIHNTYENNYSIGINSNTFGSNNKNFADSGFITGYSNTSNGACNTIFGNNNNINNDAGRCLINGSYNTIDNGVDDAFISGGNNTIDSTDNSFIFGDNNTITNDGSYAVAIGSYNTLSGSSTHKYAIGGRNTIKNSSSGQTFAIGMDNTLDGGHYSQCFGNYNTLTNCVGTNVIGRSNEVSNTNNGMFVSGYENVVNSGQSSLISGYNNNLNGPSQSIVGGSYIKMAESTELSNACLIATNSTINGNLNDSALFGSFNTINGNCNSGSIISGYNNIVGHCTSTYIGGQYNNVPSLYQGFVHGSNLIVNGSHNSVTFGKNNVEDTEANYCFVIGNGESTSERSNALAVTWSGDLVCKTITELQEKIQNLESRLAALE